jgi:ATP-dependent HslUV protease ATP-binding subunit HslU
MEHLLEDVSFTAPERSGEKFVVDASMVKEKLGPVAGNQDISRYIL